MSDVISTLKYNSDGLIPVVVQDVNSNEVLMMAWMNETSLRQTVETGYATYWSRSRQKLWIKGETSGHLQRVQTISLDCDLDTILIRVTQSGAACHENYRSCFFRDIVDGQLEVNATPLLEG